MSALKAARALKRRFGLVLLVVLTVPVMVATVTARASKPGRPSIADPIASTGHGALFDRSGDEIKVVAEFARATQRVYRDGLLAHTSEEQVAEFERKRSALLAANVWGTRGELYMEAALIDWLIAEVKPAGATELAGHNSALRTALTLPTTRLDPTAELREVISFEFAPLDDLLAAEGLAGARLPRTGAELQLSVSGGADYIDKCRAAGVPIPPDWGDIQWRSRGVLADKDEFISKRLEAEVWTYDSTSPLGRCIALPRSSDNTIELLGIICLGKESANACFWDNENDGRRFFPKKGEPIRLLKFGSGDKLVNDQCTDCHAGENPYIIHPNAILSGGEPMSAVSMQPADWYKPFIRPDWSQNPGPTNILNGVPSERKCTGCHFQGYAGRFPEVSTALNGYCGTILDKAIDRTMPSKDEQEKPLYRNHIDTLVNACGQPLFCMKFVDFCDGIQMTKIPSGQITATWWHYNCEDNVPFNDSTKKEFNRIQNVCPGGNGSGLLNCRNCGGLGDWYFVIDSPLDGTLDLVNGVYPGGSCSSDELRYTMFLGACVGLKQGVEGGQPQDRSTVE